MEYILSNTHENSIRPAYDGAKSRLAQATDHLGSEQTALVNAQTAVDTFHQKLDTAEKLPKNAVHDGHELEGAVTFHQRRTDKATDAVTEAQRAFEQQKYLLTEAQVLDRAEALAAWDRTEWAGRFAKEIEGIVDKFMSEVYDLNRTESEAIRLGQSIGLDSRVINPENRARIQTDTGRASLVVDGQKVYPIYPSLGLDALRESIRDHRHDTLVAEAEQERREQREAEEAERKAEQERVTAHRAVQAEPAPFQYSGSAGKPMKAFTDTKATPMAPATAGRGAAAHTAGTKVHR